jgi:thiamine biosynthesis lipoprotein
LYTRFEQSSELSILNKHFRKHGNYHKVSEEFYNLIKKLLKLAQETGGRFDPTIIDLLEINGYVNSFERDEIKKLREQYKKNRSLKSMKKYLKSRPSWEAIEIREKGDNFEVKLELGQRLDLGGLGKGYAIDCAAKKFRDSGVENFLINAGGDVLASGFNLDEDRTWKLDLAYKDPKTSDVNIIGTLELEESGQALASSGSWSRAIGDFHHLINSNSGEPKSEVVQTYVLAGNATDADGYSTALFLSGQNFLEKLEEKNIEGLLITSDGKVFATDNFPRLK